MDFRVGSKRAFSQTSMAAEEEDIGSSAPESAVEVCFFFSNALAVVSFHFRICPPSIISHSALRLCQRMTSMQFSRWLLTPQR